MHYRKHIAHRCKGNCCSRGKAYNNANEDPGLRHRRHRNICLNKAYTDKSFVINSWHATRSFTQEVYRQRSFCNQWPPHCKYLYARDSSTDFKQSMASTSYAPLHDTRGVRKALTTSSQHAASKTGFFLLKRKLRQNMSQ